MICEKCGHEIMSGAIFCPYCGEKVVQEDPVMDEPLYQADVKKVLKSGKLVVYRDRTEFVTSSVQKAIFNYTDLVSVKKEWDHIDFITEDGRKVSCPADVRCVHEAFLYIERAIRPYLAQRQNLLLSQGVRYSFPSNQGILNDGVLNLSAEQAEFKAKSGKNDIISFQDVKSVSAAAGTLDFYLFGGRTKSFAISKELRDEVLAFVTDSITPYLVQRKEALLVQGIHFSFSHSDGGTVDILADRIEYKGKSGQVETVSFQNIRTASVHSGMLELALTDGTLRSFSVDEGAGSEVLAFVNEAIEPYVTARTAGFDTTFGIDERIEINVDRGVFHIIRQNGKEITDEWSLDALTRCEWVENKELTALASVVSGGIALFKNAAKMAGSQAVSETEDRISSLGAVVTVRTDQGVKTENIWFGIFTAGMSRTNKKYDLYVAEWTKLSDFLKTWCPACELMGIAAPDAAADIIDEMDDVPVNSDAATRQDDLGIAKYIEGVSRFIGNCVTPMTIAFQGNRGSGRNSTLGMLFDHMADRCRDNLLWINARELPQGESDGTLSVLVGETLIKLLNGEGNAETKERATNIAAGVIRLVAGAISQGDTAGDNLVDGIFKRNQTDSISQMVTLFDNQLKAKTQDRNGKVIFFIDGLDQFEPTRAVALLEAMRDFCVCQGCVFIIAVNHDDISRGAQECYSESKAKQFFDRIFKATFQVPASSYNVQGYVKGKLEDMGIQIVDESELELYAALIQNSVGKDLENIDRLFVSFQLLKDMTGGEVYADTYKRTVLFALLCMQMRFRGAYDYTLRQKDGVTPEFLAELFGESTQPWNMDQADSEIEAYQNFSSVFARVVNLDDNIEIAEEECRSFTEVLELSGVTSR